MSEQKETSAEGEMETSMGNETETTKQASIRGSSASFMGEEHLRRFLDLADVREFTYDVQNNILENFRYGKDREVFFRGPLEEWERDFRSRIDPGGGENVRKFCDALKEGKESFEVRFTYKGLARFIKGVTIEEPGRGKIVYGVLMMGQAVVMPAQNRELTFNRASDRDPMLNMLNKKAITEYAQRILERKDCPNTYLVILDLDNFKMVNDTFGHLCGDEVLVTVTEIINRAVGEKGVVGRIGGDEILIVTRDVADKAELRPILREIRSTVEDTYKGKMDDLSLTCSIGAAAFPEHGKSYKEVMELADKMLYLAKEKGRNRYLIYTPELHHDLIAPNGEKAEIKSGFSMEFDKIGIVQFMMDDYLRRGTSSNEVAFSNVGTSFKLGEILIVYEMGKVGFRWTPQEISYGDEDLKWIKLEEAFFQHFDKNNLFVVDWLAELDGKDPALKAKLEGRDIQSALFYRLRDKGRPEGYVLFAKKTLRQKWSEYELLALSTIAKIFEMSVYP